MAIWDTITYEKRKTFSTTELTSNVFVDVGFSCDQKFIIVQGGEPDWVLLIFSIEKGKVSVSFFGRRFGKST